MILGRWRQSAESVRQGAAGYRAYAVGDVHGRLDLLDALLDRIAADHSARGGPARPLLVFLGDLIDRGPDSRGVVDRVLNGPLPGFRTITVCGNHEEVLLRLLAGEKGLLHQWLHFGGDLCIASYGGDPLLYQSVEEERALSLLRALIPAEHQTFLAGLADTFRFGDYLFVHAGIRPGVALQDQLPRDLRWIRRTFLDDPRDHGVMVVHGHTISRDVDLQSNRIGIDTGAYHYGVLTALAVEGEQHWFLQQREVTEPLEQDVP